MIIAIIGAGQIGSRHLQALANLKINHTIQIVDPSKSSLIMSKERFNEVRTDETKVNVEYYSQIDELANELEVVIIATTADIRKKVIFELINKKQVKYLVLEKVAFQSIEDFDEVETFLKENEIKCWINCPRRMWDIYKWLKEKITDHQNINMLVSAAELGIGCNSIHFIDLLAFITNQNKFILNTDDLAKEVFPSKREGYVEFYGNLKGVSSDQISLNIVSYSTGQAPVIVEISTNRGKYLFDERTKIVYFSEEKNHWNWEQKSFNTPFQSQLTNIVVNDILNNGSCGLTPIDISKDHHESLLFSLTNYYNKITSKGVKLCPIT